MTLADEYFNYTKKYRASHGEKTLVLMQVGSFFECYAMLEPDGSYSGSHIQEFAIINDMSIAKKNICVGKNEIVMAGFGLGQLEKYVKKMLTHGYTVVVYSQDIQSKNTTRSLACIYSPGTFFNNNETIDNENNYNQNLSNNTICIWLHVSNANQVIKESTITIGISLIDILTGKLINYEYSNHYINSPTVYDQLEKYVAIYNPTEVIIITNNKEENFIDTVINYANIQCQKFHKIYITDSKTKSEFQAIAENCEKQKYQSALIDKIYGIGSFHEKQEFREYSIANQSLCFLLDFIEKHNPCLVKSIDYPIFENHCEKLVLANHSLKQLNIISDNRYNGKLSCVANFLNNCITNIGKRRFNYDLLHPISNSVELEKSYDIIENLISTNFYKTIREELNNVRDIEKIERKLILNTINPKDFYILHNNLSKINTLFQKIVNNPENNFFYKSIQSYIPENISDIVKKLNDFIENNFNLEKTQMITLDKLSSYNLEHLDFINKNYNLDLNILLKNSIDAREQFEAISHFFSNILSDFEKPKQSRTSVKQSHDDKTSFIKIHETTKNDAMLVITKRRAMILKECIKKLIDKNGKICEISYASKYTNQNEILLLDLSQIDFKIHGNNQTNLIISSSEINKIAYTIQNSKDILIDALIKHFNLIVKQFIEFNNKNKLALISRFIAFVDLSQAKTYNAVKFNYCKPKIVEINCKTERKYNKSFVNFTKMRHCLIEHLNLNEIYVSNDLELGNKKNGMLLYGTNAVGKTSFIKSIGIAIIMAQAGMFVPCETFSFYPYQYLFTRILGNDNIFKGLSTFAVEMCELRTILKYATKNSIILGDELCSGTESTSALSIFVTSLEKLHEIDSSFLFATHFHEILEYQEIKDLKNIKISHMSVVFDKQKNKLIYDRKLKDGPGEAMYGLEVCKSLSMPDEFIERAYEIRNKYNKNLEKVLLQKKSKYNSKKIKGKCEICNKNPGSEIHHLQFQKNANNEGIIDNEFNKNHKANLINICQECHDYIHKENKEYKFVKTNTGYELQELE